MSSLNKTNQKDSSCRSEGTQLMKTFDGNFFPLQSGSCTYNLIVYGNLWWVTLTLTNCLQPSTCRKVSYSYLFTFFSLAILVVLIKY